MSTNVPNLKQIGGGHRKNGQKFVDLMWNDPGAFVYTIDSRFSPRRSVNDNAGHAELRFAM